MTVDPLCIRWPALTDLVPRVPTTAELLARDDATSTAIRAYLAAASTFPTRSEIRL